MSDTVEKISLKEKVGYGLGDMAANFLFQTMLVFQLNFYTDTFGITAAAVGTMFLVVGVAGAFFDPVMGIIADRTSTRWGKFRPWILWTAVPFGVIGLAAFTTPDLSPSGKLIYAYVTYTLLTLIYSANNVPYSALGGVITGEVAERTSLLSVRQIFANSAAFIVQAGAIPMYKYFGQGDSAKGYQMTIGLFSLLSVAFFVITFWTTKERIQPAPGQRSSLREDLAGMWKSGPFIAVFLLTITIFTGLSMRGGTMLYYFKYYVNNEDLFSLFNVFGLGSLLAGIVVSPRLSARYGKKNLFIWGLSLAALFTAVFLMLPPDAVVAAFGAEVLRQFAWGWTAPLLWAMMADVADYVEWKTGRRATAMVFAIMMVALKAGLAIGRSLASWMLSLYGYVPNVAQTEQAQLGIRLSASVVTAGVFALGVVCLLCYGINKEVNLRMAAELAERRRGYAG